MSPGVTFFIDHSLGKQVADALRKAGAGVQLLADHFPPNEPDEAWIPEVTRRGWVILTKEKHIRSRPAEREAAITAGARIVMLSSGNMTGEQMAALFEAHLREIEQLATTHPPPFLAVLSPHGLRVTFPRPADG